ncbi:hypothetical protein CLOLEP_00752 [[Clostridium] leptum DSM 753]|jgi:hypothetical protein|uniref:Uncharacterized protein n=1 Tax=[Clostridium] leptum DSM 753 TaxID=428125 RepID=A7VQC4_9FIRM|nr:hypothetical protein CLOLEP_00752 [[Clostridium] leptum DSM 753]
MISNKKVPLRSAREQKERRRKKDWAKRNLVIGGYMWYNNLTLPMTAKLPME